MFGLLLWARPMAQLTWTELASGVLSLDSFIDFSVQALKGYELENVESRWYEKGTHFNSYRKQHLYIELAC